MSKAIRHGDLAFFQIKTMPKGLKKSASNILLKSGSSGNSHSFRGGTFYPKTDGQFIIGYFKAKNTVLHHAEHGRGDKALKEAKLPDGVYEIRRQSEYTHQGMVQVQD